MSIDPSWSSFGLGIALIFYAGYALLSPVFIVPRKAESGFHRLLGNNRSGNRSYRRVCYAGRTLSTVSKF